MRVDPIKPTLKAPGSQRLILKRDQLVSNIAFNFNLRRFMEALPPVGMPEHDLDDPSEAAMAEQMRAAAQAEQDAAAEAVLVCDNWLRFRVPLAVLSQLACLRIRSDSSRHSATHTLSCSLALSHSFHTLSQSHTHPLTLSHFLSLVPSL